MRYAIVENEKVVNIAISDAPLDSNWIASDTAVIGDEYKNGQFTQPAPDYDAQWAVIRAERNAKLAASDWTQLSDAPVDNLAWAVYRQELRDITTQSDPFAIEWPSQPLA
jgi:hypothetical protein